MEIIIIAFDIFFLWFESFVRYQFIISRCFYASRWFKMGFSSYWHGTTISETHKKTFVPEPKIYADWILANVTIQLCSFSQATTTTCQHNILVIPLLQLQMNVFACSMWLILIWMCKLELHFSLTNDARFEYVWILSTTTTTTAVRFVRDTIYKYISNQKTFLYI